MPSPEDLPNSGIEPETPAAPALPPGSPNTTYQRSKVTFVSRRDEKDQKHPLLWQPPKLAAPAAFLCPVGTTLAHSGRPAVNTELAHARFQLRQADSTKRRNLMLDRRVYVCFQEPLLSIKFFLMLTINSRRLNMMNSASDTNDTRLQGRHNPHKQQTKQAKDSRLFIETTGRKSMQGIKCTDHS